MRTIRIASKEELAVVQHIATQAYHHSYIPILGQDQVDFMLRKIYNLEALSEQMDGGHIFIIGMEDGEDIGFASYNRTETDRDVFKLQKLYLLPEQQGRGLGRFLVNEVVSQARAAEAKSLRLNV